MAWREEEALITLIYFRIYRRAFNFLSSTALCRHTHMLLKKQYREHDDLSIAVDFLNGRSAQHFCHF